MVTLEPASRFLLQLFVVVLLARLLGRVATKLGQPMVVAELVAGILLGPSVLGIVAPRVAAGLFTPDSLELLHVVSQFAVVLFMFVIGLEFDPQLSRGRVRGALLTAQAGFLVPFGLGLLLARHLYDQFSDPSVSGVSFGLFIGAALSLSAFPVVARLLAERRLLRARVGVMAITCAAIDGVAAWCMIAFVVGWLRADGLGTAALTTALALGFTVLMIVGVRPLLARIVRQLPRPAELGQDRVAVVLLMLLASSWITDQIGIHAMFGAFLLGAILPRDGGLAHALADKLEGLVVVVLLPLFFAYSGVRTQISLLDSAAWSSCALLVVVACVGKLGAGTLAARVTGLSWREAGALGVLMNARGLFVLVLLNVGLDLGVITPTVFTMMVVMALITTFMATPMLDLVYPNGQHARDLLAEAEPEAQRAVAVEPTFSMLICYDAARPSETLTHLAKTLTRSSEGRLHALHLRRPELGEVRSGEGDQGELGELKPLSFVSVDPAADICRVAEGKHAQLVVLEWAEPGLGPEVAAVLERCRRDIGVVLDSGGVRFRTVVVATRGGPALTQVFERLRAAGADVRRADLDDPVEIDVDLVVVEFDDAVDERGALANTWSQQRARGVSLLLVRSYTAMAEMSDRGGR